MNRKYLLLISAVFLLIIAILSASSMDRDKNSGLASSDPIDSLINNSLSIQYGTDDIDLKSVFTEEFINNLGQNSNFDKKKLAPYQIIYKNYNLREEAANEYVVSVSIEDKDGSYIQVIHITKEEGVYRISRIEYDI
ncbi:MAG: hypothetical protein K0R34_3018 [Herbinix sp.]|nr:hypothetical protein [Herbinix sp.]